MGLLQIGAKLSAKYYKKRFASWANDASGLQQKEFNNLIKKGRETAFGREHNFDNIKSYEDFKKNVPIREYEDLKPYIDRIIKGEKNVLWPAKTLYFAKSSGTTSGTKYLPITTDSIDNHISSTRYALLMYVLKTGNTDFLKGKLMFISGSPELDKTGDILTGRLSGIVNHHVPGFLRRNQMPSYKTNCIEVWEDKLEAIIEETRNENMTLISGIPLWVELYFERLLQKTGKSTVKELFPDFSLFVHGGVSFDSYKKRIDELIGGNVDYLELYPASEGFIAFQDDLTTEGMMIIPDMGIFFEFIPAEDFYKTDAPRLLLEEVKTGVNYVIIINNNAGIWGYNLGDTVKFVSKNPYRLIVTGRIKQFTSTFGEHVIGEEVETSIREACNETGAEIVEFTLAPLVHNPEGPPCHEWFIEFKKKPKSMKKFRETLDQLMQNQNPYYRELVKGKILQPLIVRKVKEGGFLKYMKSIGKLGGQNKVPHLKNDRSIAEYLENHLVK